MTILMAFTFSFKFHMLQLSYWHGSEYRGEWTPDAWGVWNGLVITYLISSYFVMMGSCAFFLSNNQSLYGTWIYYVTMETLVLSTYVAILLLVVIFTTCQCSKTTAKPKENIYDKLAAESSALVDDSTQSAKKEVPLSTLISKKIDLEMGKIKRKIIAEEPTDEEEDTEGQSTARKRKPQRIEKTVVHHEV